MPLVSPKIENIYRQLKKSPNLQNLSQLRTKWCNKYTTLSAVCTIKISTYDMVNKCTSLPEIFGSVSCHVSCSVSTSPCSHPVQHLSYEESQINWKGKTGIIIEAFSLIEIVISRWCVLVITCALVIESSNHINQSSAIKRP